MARKMKDSGVEWIGEIPESWTVLKLSHLLSNISSGVSVNAGVQAAGEGEIGVLKTSCVRTGNFDVTENKSVDPAEIQKVACPVKKGAVIVSRMNTPELVGLCGYVEEDNEKIFLPDRLWQVHFNALASPIYLWLYLNSHSVRFYYASIAVGSSSSMQNISQAEFASLRVPLPPVTEQEEIVRYLTGEITAIDASIAKTQESIEEYKKLKQAVITQAVTKGIRPGRVMKDSGVEWIGDIPEEWELRKLKYAVSVRNEKSHFSPSSCLYIGLENLGSMRSDIIPSDSQYDEGDYASCEAGDILYSKLRPYLCKCIITPVGACCTGEFLVIKSFVGLKEYLRYYLLGTEWTKNVTASTYGAKMPRANEAFILNQMCLMPSVEEQREIAAYLDEKCAAIDTLIEKKQAIITALEAYKKSLIYEYVTGKKEVTV